MNFDKILSTKLGEETAKIFISFLSDTKSDETLVVVLKAHLYIERELSRVLTESLFDEKDMANRKFGEKLSLAKSLGLLEEIHGSINKVNSIRNNYAHNLSYQFSENDFIDLISTLPKEIRDRYEGNYELFG